MLKLPTSIRIVALVGCLILVLPISAILNKTDGFEMNRSAVTNPNVSAHPDERPARNCPVMELRAGLALLSLKPASKVTVNAPIKFVSLNTEQFPPAQFPIANRINPFASEPLLSVLGVLRI